MKKSIFKTPESFARLQRNAFDLSKRVLFTASAGQLLPVLSLECNPDEHFEINPSMFLRTQTLNSAAFARMKQKIEFFFVPYRLLMTRYRQFIMGTDYPTSSMISGESPIKLPHFNLYNNDHELDVNDPNMMNGLVDYLHCAPYPLTDMHGYSTYDGNLRILDLLNYGVHQNKASTPTTGTPCPSGGQQVTPVVTPFRGLAYQKIYADFYRLPLYDSVDVTSFNIDDLVLNTNGDVDMITYNTDRRVSFERLSHIFELRYHPWKKDYFTNNRPSFAGAEYTNYVLPPIMPSVNNGEPFTPEPNDRQSFLRADSSEVMNISISNLRSAYALDKLLDLTNRAKDGSYASQVAAHFGFNVRTDASKCNYLGGADAPVSIGEITSTADTAGAPLGKVGGKGISSMDGTIRFDTPEHGIIMGIYSVVPECDYNASGTDRMLTKTSREQFFVPEFDSLGYQPTYAYEFDSSDQSDYNPTDVIGWNPRYAEYKTAVDEIHGEFKRGGTLNSWAAPRVRAELYGNFAQGLNAHFLMVDPSVLNPIFALQYNGSQPTDQFMVNSFFNISAVRPMSVSGLPYTD